MGFLSGLTEKVFGGTDNSAQKEQIKANAASKAYTEAMAKQSAAQANYLYSQGDYARNTGINAAMGLMGNNMPTQMGMYQNGNVAAQQQLLAGLPQYQNAILGMPVNNNALQPYVGAMPSPESYRTQLPSFGMQAPPHRRATVGRNGSTYGTGSATVESAASANAVPAAGLSTSATATRDYPANARTAFRG